MTTLEKNILEISVNDSFCYKVDNIKFLNDEEKSSFTNGNKILTELHEDLSNLIDAYSRNFRNKFNQILKEKLSKLQNDEED